jgi:hypothetical protein
MFHGICIEGLADAPIPSSNPRRTVYWYLDAPGQTLKYGLVCMGPARLHGDQWRPRHAERPAHRQPHGVFDQVAARAERDGAHLRRKLNPLDPASRRGGKIRALASAADFVYFTQAARSPRHGQAFFL